MKETFYFTHDYNARSDEKIKKLIRKHWMQWYGLFWSIVEDLYQNANALRMDIEGIAFDMRVDEEIVKSILNDFDLFIIEWDIFGSKSVETRLLERDEKSSKARESARKRWEKKDANALRTQSDSNAIKEKKRKEKKEKENNKELLEKKLSLLDRWTVRYDFFSFLLDNEFIEEEYTQKILDSIEAKIMDFQKTLWSQRAVLEIESFIEHHRSNKTVFKSTIGRLNTWLSNKLPK